MTPPVPVPTLDELARDPAQAATLPLEATRALLTRCALAYGGVSWSARLLEAAPNRPGAPQGASEQRLVDVRTVAARLGISSNSVYRRAPQWPFTVRIGRALRFSAQGLDAYLRTRRDWTLDLMLDRVPYSRLV